MARRKRILASDSTGDDDVNLTPMLDVVFILLIFFIVTAQFIKEPGVDIQRTEVDNLDRQNPLGILSHWNIFSLQFITSLASMLTRNWSRSVLGQLRLSKAESW